MTDILDCAFELARPLFRPTSAIPARRFANSLGQIVYTKVAEGTAIDLTESEADCFLIHAFAIVEAEAVRAIGEKHD